MCGIAGFFISCAPNAIESSLMRMGKAMLHRGPDASGVFHNDTIAFVHRRLSIIDLSAQGNQPMVSRDGRYVIVFNGEIYNFIELKESLEEAGTIFRTKTDTEVLLELFAKEGVACLNKLNGMFAFAIWDNLEKNLFMARDRIGKNHCTISMEVPAGLPLPPRLNQS